MNEKAMREYEEKVKELHSNFRKIRLRIFLVWLAVNIAAAVAVYFTLFANKTALAVILFAIIVVGTSAFALSTSAHWKKEELSQEEALREKIPMGGFKTRE